jgi:hypothetical protein
MINEVANGQQSAERESAIEVEMVRVPYAEIS